MGTLLLLFLQLSAHPADVEAYRKGESLYLEKKFAEAVPWFEKAAQGSQALVAEFMLGNACIQAHLGGQALQAFASLFQVPPDSAAAHLLTAEMLLRQQAEAEAEKEAGRALEADPHIPQAHMILGKLALAKRNAARAIDEFQKEIAINPNFAMAYYRLGEAYVVREAWDDAISALERSLWMNPAQDGPYLLLGKAYLHRGDLDDAQASLRHVLQMDPQNSLARQLLATVAPEKPVAPANAPTDAGKVQEPGAPQAQAQAQADAAAPESAYRRGLTAYRRHDYVPAAKSLEQALTAIPENSPRYPETVRMIGQSEYLAGHIAAAIPWLEKARTSGAHGNELLYMLGNSYLRQRQIPQGRASFAGLLGAPADSGAARLFTAQMLMRLEFEDEAQKELEAALARQQNLPEAHFMLGEIAIYRAQLDTAIAQLQKEIALNPDFALAYYRLGDAYTRREDWDHAIPPLQRAVWLNPTYSGPYILLGKAYFKKSDLSNAERMLRRALQMDPRNTSAHYLLGRTLMQSGQTEEGKKLLHQWEELRRESGQ